MGTQFCRHAFFRRIAAAMALLLVFPGSAAARDLLLEYATIVDGRGGAPFNGSVLIRGERIARICRAPRRCRAPGARVIDLSGRFLIPGLIDSHVHLATDPAGEDRDAAARLEAAFRMGVTSVRDMAGDARALRRLADGAEAGDRAVPRISYAALFGGPSFFADPRTRAASAGFAPGTAPWQRAIAAGIGTAELRERVAAARATGASAIKLYADLDGATAARIAAEAHRQGLRVWSHAALFPARPGEVVAAGVDSVSHGLLLGYELAAVMPEAYARRTPPLALAAGSADDTRIVALFGAMRARGIVLDATLSVGRGLARARPGAAGFADPAAAVRWSHEAIRAAAAAGVTISAGSDTGMNAPDALHAELALLIEAGLTPMQAIVAATQGGARALGRADELGTIQPGRLADLVVLRRDPTADIEALRDVALVIKSGTVHEAQPRE